MKNSWLVAFLGSVCLLAAYGGALSQPAPEDAGGAEPATTRSEDGEGAGFLASDAAEPGQPLVQLPVTRLVLFTNGVAY